MNARPLLARVAAALRAVRLDAILIGNGAAALRGAPVTTLDLDFFFRDTPTNRRKLKALAQRLDGTLLRPYYPVSGLFRLMSNSDSWQLDFLPAAYGIRSFEALRSRASVVMLDGDAVVVSSLKDVIRSKRAANRPRDRAVLPVLEETLRALEEEK